ncbi:aldehyde dehydrogenase family protein [Parasphingorhabdus pacifica]
MTTLELRNFVDGGQVDTVAGETLPLVDPSTGEQIGTAPLTRWTDVDEVMRVAALAYEAWSQTTPRERQMLLLRIADAVEARGAELIAAECRNTGKLWSVVRDEELPAAVDLLRFYAAAARVLESGAAGEYERSYTSLARREPIGVCAQVTSWTHPLLLAVSKFAPALAAGNTVVLKPAETTPVSTALLVEIAGELLPPGVLNLVCGDRDSGRAMVAHEVPGMFSITGSVRSGMEVAGSTAADLKRAHLQLGGKAPAVVFDDADLGRAVPEIARAAFGNAGQSCTSASRVLAGPAVYDELVAGLAERAREMRPGAPRDSGASFGPLNSLGQLELVEEHLDRLPEHARLVAGGRREGTAGFFHEATVLAGMEQDDELVQHEVLGPVVTVQQFSHEQEAVELANGVRYGLVASAWTRDHARAMRMARRLQAGTVWLNAHHPFVAEMPHSGFKHSASARDFGRHGLEEYSRLKHVMSYVDD